jgi:hypothetical protein
MTRDKKASTPAGIYASRRNQSIICVDDREDAYPELSRQLPHRRQSGPRRQFPGLNALRKVPEDLFDERSAPVRHLFDHSNDPIPVANRFMAAQTTSLPRCASPVAILSRWFRNRVPFLRKHCIGCGHSTVRDATVDTAVMNTGRHSFILQRPTEPVHAQLPPVRCTCTSQPSSARVKVSTAAASTRETRTYFPGTRSMLALSLTLPRSRARKSAFQFPPPVQVGCRSDIRAKSLPNFARTS